MQRQQDEMQKLQPLLQINDDLKGEIQTLNMRVDEKEFKFKALQEELRMKERQLERLEDQNKIFCSDTSSEDSEEEAKNAKSRGHMRHASNSFEEVDDNRRSGANTTAKSLDSNVESENMRAFQNSLDSL